MFIKIEFADKSMMRSNTITNQYVNVNHIERYVKCDDGKFKMKFKLGNDWYYSTLTIRKFNEELRKNEL